jgi:hypothetical protein
MLLLVLLLVTRLGAASSGMSEKEAVHLASREAKHRGYDLSLYLPPHPRLHLEKGVWEIHYFPKPGKGGFVPVDAEFLIVVHGSTGKIDFSCLH